MEVYCRTRIGTYINGYEPVRNINSIRFISSITTFSRCAYLQLNVCTLFQIQFVKTCDSCDSPRDVQDGHLPKPQKFSFTTPQATVRVQKSDGRQRSITPEQVRQTIRAYFKTDSHDVDREALRLWRGSDESRYRRVPRLTSFPERYAPVSTIEYSRPITRGFLPVFVKIETAVFEGGPFGLESEGENS